MATENIIRPIILDSTGREIVEAIKDITMTTVIVDDLTTADPGKALSSRQGKILKDLDDDLRGSASDYNPSTSYVPDDYCIYQDLLYKCIANTTGAWDSTKWVAINLRYVAENSGNDVRLSIEDGELQVSFEVDDYDTSVSYTVGDFCHHSTAVYVCIEDTTGSWNSSCWELYEED